ncbi:MAG: DUF1456 family protein [Desulfobacterales bacterium]|nr:DUF1456 family protein [Desulfobacterales bacterium]
MDNNDILRRLRYAFDFSDGEMAAIFGHSGTTISRDQVAAWLKREEDPEFMPCRDKALARFLNGFIIDRRGRRDGPQPPAEKRLTNNLILVKLKIALALKAEDVLALLKLAGMTLGKAELSALFRKPGHKHYRLCKDQILRNFLTGLQRRHRPTPDLDLKAQDPWAPNSR